MDHLRPSQLNSSEGEADDPGKKSIGQKELEFSFTKLFDYPECSADYNEEKSGKLPQTGSYNLSSNGNCQAWLSETKHPSCGEGNAIVACKQVTETGSFSVSQTGDRDLDSSDDNSKYNAFSWNNEKGHVMSNVSPNNLSSHDELWDSVCNLPNSATKCRKPKSVKFTVEPLVYKQTAPNSTRTSGEITPASPTNHATAGKTVPNPLVISHITQEAKGPKSPRSPKSPKSPLLSSDESYYDTASSTSSTAALLKKAAHNQLFNQYDNSASDKEPKMEPKSTSFPMKNMPTGVGIETRPIHPEFSTGIGKALLSETLDQVKRSLEELAPGHEGEKTKFMDKSTLKLRNNYLKNLTVLCLSFMLVYCSFFSLRNLQSSINHKDGLGLISMASMGCGFIVGCVIGTSIVSKVRPKWSLLGAMVGFLVYILANFHATFYTLVPATILLGLTMATMWIAQGTYLTSIAISYAALTANKPDHVLALFNGFSLFLLQVAQIIGNLMSSLIINGSEEAPEEMEQTRRKSVYSDYVPPGVNPHPFDKDSFLVGHRSQYHHLSSSLAQMDSFITDQKFINGHNSSLKTGLRTNFLDQKSDEEFNSHETWNISICGSRYSHNYEIEHNSVEIPFHTLCLLLGIFTILTLMGMLLLCAFLDKLDVIFQKKKTTMCQQMLDIVHLHKRPQLLLFIPLAIFLGIQEAFAYGEFTKGYVACPLGLHMIGYVMVCFGSSDSIVAFLSGILQKVVGRKAIIAFGCLAHSSVLICMYLWKPSYEGAMYVFIFAGALGAVDAIWQSQSCSLCGLLFKEREAAFASLRMYESLGFALGATYAPFLPMHIKIIMLGGVMGVAVLSYAALEKSQHDSLRKPVFV